AERLARNGAPSVSTLISVPFVYLHPGPTPPWEARPATIDVKGQQHKVGLDARMIDALTPTIPLGRAGTAEEAAGAVYLFCIPESDYVSGQVLVCDGGGVRL